MCCLPPRSDRLRLRRGLEWHVGADGVAQDADLLDLGFHGVADFQKLWWLARKPDAFWSASENDVAWLQSEANGELVDDARQLEDHEARARVLFGDAIDA